MGNDSYIGALATAAGPMDFYATQGYYAVRHHKPAPKAITTGAHLVTDPLRFSVQSRLVALLTERMKKTARPEEWAQLQKVSPHFSVQSFYLANGALRYYAKMDWVAGRKVPDESDDVLAAWLAPMPALRVLAHENRTSPYGFGSELPNLLNVAELGAARTGLIASWYGETAGLQLIEYRDGQSLAQMPHLHGISAGE